MPKSALAGIDIGTSKIRCILYNTNGRPLFNCSYKTPLIKLNKYSYNPVENIYELLIKLLKQSFKFSNRNNYIIKGLSISSVGEAGVPVDRNLNPLMNIIPWYDERTESFRNKFIKKHNNEIYKNTGLNDDYFYSIYKILWIKKNKPKIYSKIYKWLPVNDYYAMRLTNNVSTDYSQAMRTLLFDPKKLNWSKKMIKLFNINESILPKIINAGDKKGFINNNIKKILNLKYDCILAAGGHDHFVGIYALGGFSNKTATNSMGSAEAIAINTRKYLHNNDLKKGKFISGVFKTRTQTNYYIVGSILTSGVIIEWFRDTFKIKNFKELKKVTDISHNKNILFFPQFDFSHSPVNSIKTKGFISGIDRSTNISDIYTAILKCLTFDTKKALDFMLSKTKIKINKIICSGGSVQNKYWMGIRASILNSNLMIDKNIENVSLGSAILAGIGSKIYKNDKDAFHQINNTFEIIRKRKINIHDKNLLIKYDASIKKIKQINNIL